LRRALQSLVLVLTVLLLAACGDDAGGGGSAAGDGGDRQLTIYSGRDEELVKPLLDRFQRESGIEVKVRYGETAELAATLREEGDRSPADVFFGQDAGALGALQQSGLLEMLPQETLDKVAVRYRSAEGRWVGTSGRSRVLAYDARELRESALPRSVLDLTKPEWKGRIGWAPTNASFQAFVTGLRRVEGEDGAKRWLEGMQANDVKAFENNIVTRDAIAKGEIDAGLINHYYVLEAIAEEGSDYPVKLHFFGDGDIGSLVNVAGAAVLESSEHKDDARRFVDFLLGAEAQRYFAQDTKEYPLAAGVQADPVLPELASIRQPDLDLSDLDDLQGTLELLQETGVL
jgi:iron(III) transport system substrate-binding protein